MIHVCSRRLAAGAAVLGLGLTLGLTACGNDDISQERFLEDFSAQSPASDEIDECIVNELFDSLSQEEINDFYGDDPSEPLSESNQAAVDAASETCVTEAAGG